MERGDEEGERLRRETLHGVVGGLQEKEDRGSTGDGGVGCGWE